MLYSSFQNWFNIREKCLVLPRNIEFTDMFVSVGAVPARHEITSSGGPPGCRCQCIGLANTNLSHPGRPQTRRIHASSQHCTSMRKNPMSFCTYYEHGSCAASSWLYGLCLWEAINIPRLQWNFQFVISGLLHTFIYIFIFIFCSNATMLGKKHITVVRCDYFERCNSCPHTIKLFLFAANVPQIDLALDVCLVE